MAAQTSKRTIPTGEGLTFEKVWAMMQETAERQKETDRQMKETDRQMKELQKETDRQIKETNRQLKETLQETINETNRIVGKLGNRFGQVVEHLIVPGIEEKFNKLGFTFTRTSPNVQIKELDNPDISTEIDLFLENGDVAIAVEVKGKPNQDDVDDHVIRMEKLRIYADKRHDKRRYQGAVAGAVLSDPVRAYILKKGFYLIEQSGDTIKIVIPKGFKARNW